jgi:predicted lipid-binding transport protein (Tim44 family)
MTTPNPLIDGMMKVARLAAAAQCANAPEGPAPSAQVHAEGFEQALRALRAACPLPFEKRAGRGRPRDARSCCGRSPRYGRWRSGAPASSARASGTDEVGLTPDDFNAFEKILAEVQSAYSAEDLARLRRQVTPEMLSYFSEELSANASKGVVDRVSDVKLLQGDLAEAWREGDSDYATVAMRFSLNEETLDRDSGRVVQGGPDEATEVWTFMRVRGGHWLVSAIQQS